MTPTNDQAARGSMREMRAWQLCLPQRFSPQPATFRELDQCREATDEDVAGNLFFVMTLAGRPSNHPCNDAGYG